MPVMCLDVLLSLCYFLFLTAPIFSSYSAEFYCFSRTPAWFCHLVTLSAPGVAKPTLDRSQVSFFSPTQELVNGSWYVSIVRINDFLYLCHGVGTGVTSSCIFGILEKKTSGLNNFLMFFI